MYCHSAPSASRRGSMTTLRHWFPSLPFQQFQVLFNSLFKVLCIFPSRYLCAIGLPPIFSFMWHLPQNLCWNPNQHDSLKACAMAHSSQTRTGVSPSQLPFSKGLGPRHWHTSLLQTTIRHRSDLYRFTWWALPASVALTGGILVSFFSSA